MCGIECDASYKNGITGISAVISLDSRDYDPIDCAARSKGPVHAELTAVHKALLRLKQVKGNRRIHTLVVYTDCKYASMFLENAWTPKRFYLREILDKIALSLNEINDGRLEMIVCHTKTKHIKRVDRRATKKRKEEELRQKELVAKRVAKVEEAIVKGRDIQVYEKEGQFFAYPKLNGYLPGYRVSLEPLSCECPWWGHNWAKKGEVIINARALPCKHMCAVAEYRGVDIFQLFSHQIERVD